MKYKAETYYEDIDGTEYTLDVSFTIDHDSNYGCDADGNRGQSVTFTEVDDFSVFNEDGVDVTMKLDDILLDKITEYVVDFVDENGCNIARDYYAEMKEAAMDYKTEQARGDR